MKIENDQIKCVITFKKNIKNETEYIIRALCNTILLCVNEDNDKIANILKKAINEYK